MDSYGSHPAFYYGLLLSNTCLYTITTFISILTDIYKRIKSTILVSTDWQVETRIRLGVDTDKDMQLWINAFNKYVTKF